MKIQQSEVSLLASHSKQSELYEKESLEMWSREEDTPPRFRNGDRLELTSEAAKLEEEGFDTSLSPKLMAIVRALESLMGKKINVSFMHSLEKSKSLDEGQIQEPNQDAENERVGWGMDYSYERHEVNDESLKFSAEGNVKTEDGRSIDFSLAFSMKSHSESHESISLKAGDALIDPLVLNFDGTTVTISEIKHSFDLDLDGKSDEFSFVGSGSGFLALDKNSDGVINDGSELFGPNEGNGFNELAAYDSDGNNWIDENDEVFDQLVIWTKDEQGEEHLFSLKDKGIGALYLGSVETPFELKASSGETKAMMRESSVYLGEEGGVGTLQEIDLVV